MRSYFLPRTNIPKTAVIPSEAKKPRIKAGPKQPNNTPMINGSNDNLMQVKEKSEMRFNSRCEQ